MVNNLRPVNVSFKAHEFELYAYLLEQSSISIYIKDLIKADMLKKKKEKIDEKQFTNDDTDTSLRKGKPIF